MDSESGLTFQGQVAVSPKANRRFYELIVLLQALNKAYKDSANRKAVDLARGTEQEPDEMFRNFVSKLSQICDARPGGFTVTSFAVLQFPDKVQYVFGSNQRSTVELETVKAYISSILSSLRDISTSGENEEGEAFLAPLLRDILIFNHGRIKNYISKLVRALETCIAICGSEVTRGVSSYRKKFQQLLDSAMLPMQPDTDEEEFLDSVEVLIAALQDLQNPSISMFIRKRASNDNAGNSEPWRELRHHSSRLLSYQRAVEVLWESGQMWPELFDTFEVIYIPSSRRHLNPLSSDPQKAAAILGRHLPEDIKPKYLGLAQELQSAFRLDHVIEDQWTLKSFKPSVHVEILLLNWLEKNGITKSPQFFGGWQYIGCSKPTCRLCDYYMSSHPSGVQVRSPHGNLYVNWRMPDYADVYGCRNEDEAVRKRHEIMQSIMGRVRHDVMRVLNEKAAGIRKHDSHTYSSVMTRQVDMDAEAKPMGALVLLSDMSEMDLVNERWSRVGAENDTDDDEGRE